MNTKGQGLEEEPIPTPKIGKNYLFTIAIDDYRHCPNLYNCVRDIERITGILHQHYQFAAENTFRLYNEEATEKNIFQTFKKLVSLVQPEDNLLILYSGHGEYETDIEEGYWIPADAQKGDFSDYISNGRIVKYIKALKAHHILLIVDSCFSGSLFASRDLNHSGAVERLDAIPSRWLLTAGRNELVSDGKPGDHSPFADNIIYFLQNNDHDSLPVSELIDTVINAVVYNSSQTPRGEPLQDAGHRGGQFFFHRKGVAPDFSRRQETATINAQTGPLPFAEDPAFPGSRFARWSLMVMGLFAFILIGIWWWRPAPEKDLVEPMVTNRVSIPDIPQEQAVKEDPGPETPTGPAESLREEEVKPRLSKGEQLWRAALQTDNEDAYRMYLRRYPNGKWATEAQQKIAGKYRYTLYFTPVLKDGKQLEIHFGNGASPYHISIIKPNDEKIEKVWDSGAPYSIDLGTVQKSESGNSVIRVIVTDHHFKKAGQMLPVY